MNFALQINLAMVFLSIKPLAIVKHSKEDAPKENLAAGGGDIMQWKHVLVVSLLLYFRKLFDFHIIILYVKIDEKHNN